ncbi:MAG: carbamoyltransferase HypF [Saprospiraceae bacterium]|nr:carbamoyltransferase HypF [Saprospiraceae bacterium]
MKSWHFHIEGQVQGVGFRPFVFQLARKKGMTGWIRNGPDGVHIQINAEEHRANQFLFSILNDPPHLSRITGHSRREVSFIPYHDFQIVESDSAQEPKLIITPDLALCTRCREELDDPRSRRYQYPFTTCTDCGPRYSIMHNIPYDRINTSMAVFNMCSECEEEYHDPVERRYYAQTNSCPACPIDQTLRTGSGDLITMESSEIMEQVVTGWENGKIIAIKGIGGFLLTCDAQNSEVIRKLRRRKYRPSKPFATMIPAGWLSGERVDLNELEKNALFHFSAPVVLVPRESFLPGVFPLSEIAPGLIRLGVMLPYTPLFHLLLNKFAGPIIATSGNLSGSPIIYENEKAFSALGGIADFILDNSRDILIPEDDSVVGFSKGGRKIIYRRSRGLAPSYINPNLVFPVENILAMGAMLKSTFCYLHRSQPYISQYLGDLENFETQRHYQNTLSHFLRLLKSRPEVILTDLHPGYPSSILGAELAGQYEIPLIRIQHHKAHFAAGLAESNLLERDEKILGVVWDGTGLGEDGHIWGGEFFIFADQMMTRVGNCDYFSHILGDKMAREPRISALSTSWGVPGCLNLKRKFSELEWNNYARLLQKPEQLQTSSIGRLFDAVASILDLTDVQTYEGEAAALLEAMAQRQLDTNEPESGWGGIYTGLIFHGQDTIRISVRKLIQGILADQDAGIEAGRIALKFHHSLVEIIRQVATILNTKIIVFSGGVFQNGLLVDLISNAMQDQFDLHFHKELSPNDESISFGQLIYYSTIGDRTISN